MQKPKIKNFFISLLSHVAYIGVGIILTLTIYSAQAAWNTTVSNGTPLTPNLWNDLVAKISTFHTALNLDASNNVNMPSNLFVSGYFNYQQRDCYQITYSAAGNTMCAVGFYAAGVWDNGGGMAGMNGVVCCR